MQRASEMRGAPSRRGVQALGTSTPDDLNITNHYGTHKDPLRMPPRGATPNPYLASPIASPERFGMGTISQEEARRLTNKRSKGREDQRMESFNKRIAEQDRRSTELEEGVAMRGGSPMTRSLYGEMRSREMANISATLERQALGGQSRRKRSPSRPATQASVFSFGGDDALKP